MQTGSKKLGKCYVVDFKALFNQRVNLKAMAIGRLKHTQVV